MENLTKNIGMLLLGIWLVAWGLFMLIPVPANLTQVLAIFAIAAGIFIFLDR